MSDSRLLLTTTRLQLAGKKGILAPDAEGYYTMPIGGFNCTNSIGELYTMENVAKIFDSSSDLQRKVQNGKLTGEWGHPEPAAGESTRDYMNRASMVSDKDTCVLFREIWLDADLAKSPTMRDYNISPDTVVTMARLKPHGLQWEALQRALDDPNYNVSFSVRNLSTDRTYRGKVYVTIVQIITWDVVTSPGIRAAEKWLSPRLERHTVRVTPEMVENLERRLHSGLVRVESAESAFAVVKQAKMFFAEQNGQGHKGYADWK